MYHHNDLSSPYIAVGGLEGFSCLGDTTKPSLHYQDMSVRELRPPCSAYLGQLNAIQTSVHPINPLNEFRVASLMQRVTGSFDEFNLAATSESIPDEYSPWNPDNDSIEDALFPSLGSDLCNQPLFSEYEPDLSESTPSNHSNLNHHLTNFPANLACPQDSRPVAVANPLSLQQDINDNPANSAEIVGNKYSPVQRKKKRCKNPRYSEWQKAQKKFRYQNDPVFAEGRRIHARTYYRMKKILSKEEALKLATAARVNYFRSVPYLANSGDLRQTSNSGKTTQNTNENSDILPFPFGNEPDNRKLTPANYFSLNPHLTNPPVKLAYLQDSEPVAVTNPLNLQQDPTKNSVNTAEIVAGISSQAKRQWKGKSEYYQNNPAHAEHQRQFQKEHHKNPAIVKRAGGQKRDPSFAEGQRIYINTYNKMKRKVSKEEASRLASVVRAEFLEKTVEKTGHPYISCP